MAAIVPPGWEAAISDWDKQPDRPDAWGAKAGLGGTELIWSALSDWDKVTIAGSQIYAVASVETERTQRIQKDTTPQVDGGSTRLLGQDPATITIRLKFFNVANLAALGRIITGSLLKAPGKPYSDPVAVSHPALALLGISRMVLEGYTTPKVSGPGGTMDMTLRFLEFMPLRDMGRKTALGRDSAGLSGQRQADLGIGGQTSPSREGAAKLAAPGKH